MLEGCEHRGHDFLGGVWHQHVLVWVEDEAGPPVTALHVVLTLEVPLSGREAPELREVAWVRGVRRRCAG
eukprot:9971299-Alexandrium_andersonii.AAC.1